MLSGGRGRGRGDRRRRPRRLLQITAPPRAAAHGRPRRLLAPAVLPLRRRRQGRRPVQPHLPRARGESVVAVVVTGPPPPVDDKDRLPPLRANAAAVAWLPPGPELCPLRDWKSLMLRSREEAALPSSSLQLLPAENPRVARAVGEVKCLCLCLVLGWGVW